MQQLEEYHAGAADAHRAHGKVPLSLPAAPSPVWGVPQPVAPATPDPGQPGLNGPLGS